ncbi:hypothetical protein BKA70DRAFT_1268510 [Coprinopsis sp. MPI-PUGE-AT-0042]|nr:hypothetical protein BKA70DRAFT_1268510 [Coprinopsis sp. MPI-PUGE-AT-0042]
MSSNSNYAYRIEEYPNSMLWVAVPSVLLVSAYFIRRWYKSYQLRVYGIGRGAKGFQTNVGKVRITPEIAETHPSRRRRLSSRNRSSLQTNGRARESRPTAFHTPKRNLNHLHKYGKTRSLSWMSVRQGRCRLFVGRGRTPARRQSSSGGVSGIVGTPGKRTTRSASRQMAAETKAREDQANEWLPDHITTGNTKKRRGRKA